VCIYLSRVPVPLQILPYSMHPELFNYLPIYKTPQLSGSFFV
jgi:hypothetical protein